MSKILRQREHPQTQFTSALIGLWPMFSGHRSLEAPTKQYVRGPVSGPSNTAESGIFQHKQPQKWRKKQRCPSKQKWGNFSSCIIHKGSVVPKKSQVKYALYLHSVGTKIHQSQATKPTPPKPCKPGKRFPKPEPFSNQETNGANHLLDCTFTRLAA